MRTLDREHIRPVLESEIERLINALDLLDSDVDLEDSFDAEELSEDEGAQCDDEASLTATRNRAARIRQPTVDLAVRRPQCLQLNIPWKGKAKMLTNPPNKQLKPSIKDLPLDLLDFEDELGRIRSLYECANLAVAEGCTDSSACNAIQAVMLAADDKLAGAIEWIEYERARRDLVEEAAANK